MLYQHIKTPNYAVPTHQNAQLCCTNTLKRPIMQYQYMKTPIYAVLIHDKNPITEYRHMKTPNYGVPTHENAKLRSTNK